jgi:adenylate cyclase
MEAPRSVKRRLAAILSADAKGYSRLMGEDEEATIRTLSAHREVMFEAVQSHAGRLVDSPGDNLLAEFPSVVEAVQCAVDIQRELHTRNADLSPDRTMEFRIGINLGDVIVEGEKIYGDGINIAARLESLAEAGGICISGTVYDHVENKLRLGYESLGEQTFKNIAKPVRVYRVRSDSTATAPARDRTGARRRTYARTAAIAVGVLLLVSGSVFLNRSTLLHLVSSGTQTASAQRPSLPVEPSLVVLPFVNLGNDPQQDFMSDGLTEDLITDLSKVPGLFVVARNSAFTFKGKPRRAEEIGLELGVRYILEGSARKSGDQVRITAQLVDSTNGFHVWAEHYDEPLSAFFKLQDEIRQKILFALRVKLSPEEQERFRLAGTDNMEAYRLLWDGITAAIKFTKEQNQEARRLCTQATTLDPNYSAAYACLSETYTNAWVYGWEVDPQTVDRGFVMAQRAVALDDFSPWAHMALGDAYHWRKQPDRAIAEGQRSIELGPSCASCYGELAEHLTCVGRPTQALELLDKALRLDPKHPEYQYDIAFVHVQLGMRDQALDEVKQVLIQLPDFLFGHQLLAVLYADAGEDEEAKVEAAKYLALLSPWTVAQIREGALRISEPCVVYADFNRHFFDALQRIGVSDHS